MSTHAIEKALWLVCYDERGAEQFAADPDAFLERYHLEPDERQLVKDGDVRALLDRRVNDMLVYSFFQASHGRGAAPLYLERVKVR